MDISKIRIHPPNLRYPCAILCTLMTRIMLISADFIRFYPPNLRYPCAKIRTLMTRIWLISAD